MTRLNILNNGEAPGLDAIVEDGRAPAGIPDGPPAPPEPAPEHEANSGIDGDSVAPVSAARKMPKVKP